MAPPGFTKAAKYSLTARLERLVAGQPGWIGVAALHVESGSRAGVHPDDLFPMASVVKLPVAIAVLARVDRGTLALDSLVLLEPRHMRVGASPLSARHPRGNVRVPVSELVDVMLIDSDNAACDRLIELLGGPQAVEATMRDLRVPRISVDRTEAELGFDWLGVAQRPPESTWTRTRLDSLARAVPVARRSAAMEAFQRDPRDTSSPFGMAWLLMRIQQGVVLSAPSTKRLLDAMTRCATGPGRLPARLPRGTPVARKTGTLGISNRGPRIANDVGIVTLPDGRGHLAIAVFVKEWTGTIEEAEARIARLARACYDAALEADR
ncbi:MAG: class A beta-lactamase [Candidatus Eiseniibacteriota bacterium]